MQNSRTKMVTLPLSYITSILARRHRGCRHDARLAGLTPSRWRLSYLAGGLLAATVAVATTRGSQGSRRPVGG